MARQTSATNSRGTLAQRLGSLAGDSPVLKFGAVAALTAVGLGAPVALLLAGQMLRGAVANKDRPLKGAFDALGQPSPTLGKVVQAAAHGAGTVGHKVRGAVGAVRGAKRKWTS